MDLNEDLKTKINVQALLYTNLSRMNFYISKHFIEMQ